MPASDEALSYREHNIRPHHISTTHFQPQSKYGHYSVLVLVSLDISSIFADLILQLLTCEGRVPAKDGNKASDVLGIVSLVFSCLFMVCFFQAASLFALLRTDDRWLGGTDSLDLGVWLALLSLVVSLSGRDCHHCWLRN